MNKERLDGGSGTPGYRVFSTSGRGHVSNPCILTADGQAFPQSGSDNGYWSVKMTRRKPGKLWRRTGNEEDPNKRPRRTAQLSSLPAATNVYVETAQQYLGPANPQLSPSSPEPLLVASSSSCPISPTSPISAWLDSFEVSWNKVRPTLRRAVVAGEVPSPEDRRHLMRVTVDAMREHSLNPTRREKPKRTQRDDENGDDDQPAVATCVRVDSYGCVRWQPEDYPDGETSASLEEKKFEMLDIFSREGLKGAERGRNGEAETPQRVDGRNPLTPCLLC
ncbi:uncharacterized protein LOC121718897 isoform X2 [Scomber scombrus]|uniref:Uncharacterized protein LOC121718897 isoform X2 n=1 Tax=Scomber scombrus TaxID=13677 RepID=A0AAV1PDK9_SCOSC